ncbi:hypothetical protein CUMW_185740 [Citrus unshiu]|nr:hypothetical protein CUMW_185740 [Citrus unshiu]
MGWLQSLFSPLKKLWLRLHSTPKKRRGIYILYDDVKSCPYEDVHKLSGIYKHSKLNLTIASSFQQLWVKVSFCCSYPSEVDLVKTIDWIWQLTHVHFFNLFLEQI